MSRFMVSILVSSLVNEPQRGNPQPIHLREGRLRIPHKLQNVLLGVAHGSRERELCIYVTGDGNNEVLFGAGQFVLGSDHLNVVGGAGLKTILSEQEFALREVLPLLGNAYLLGRRIQIQERLADVLVYTTLKIGNLIVDAPDAARKLPGLAVAVAIEDREIDLALNQAGGLHASDAAAQFANVSIEAKIGRASW